MKTPLSDEAIAIFPDFVREVRDRLDRGRTDYGDASFTRPLPELIGELAQEALDIAGWSFLIWKRIRGLADALAALESATQLCEPVPPGREPAETVIER